MNARAILLLVVFAVLAIFVALNWTSFMAPTSLSLLFATVHAPLGLVLLGFIALLSALFLAFATYLQGTALVDARRHSRELEALRELADKAEASRLHGLQAQLDAVMASVATQQDGGVQKLMDRLDTMDSGIGAAIECTERSIAAYIGALEAKVGRDEPAGRG